MKNILKITAAPLLALFIFVLGSGLFTTLLAVRLHHVGSSALFIGTLTGVYYAGLAYGSFRVERYILAVGHIRAFAAFASFLAVITFLQGVLLNEWVWLGLRFLSGLATAGIFVVIESWLLAESTASMRGRVLALYMISLYAAQALGQFLINLSSPENLMLFAVTAMLCSLSVIPIALTRTPSPEMSEPSSLGFKKLFKISGSGIAGSLCSGLMLGAIYGLLPLVILQKTANTSAVGSLMALVIFGGMLLQYPVGKLSDFIERRLILLVLSLLTVLVSAILIYFFEAPLVLYVALFFLGGLIFTLYPVSISQACDNLKHKDIIAGTQGMLLMYSCGATLGPCIASLFVYFLGASGLFVYLIAVGVLFVLFLSWRRTTVAALPQEEAFIVIPQTSPIMAELDPRAEEGAGSSRGR